MASLIGKLTKEIFDFYLDDFMELACFDIYSKQLKYQIVHEQ